ncbi:MAG: energy transducer TonB [Bacteroidota bacterium]
MKLSTFLIIGLIAFFQLSALLASAHVFSDSISCEKVYEIKEIDRSARPQFTAAIYQALQKGNLNWADSKKYLKGYICEQFNARKGAQKVKTLVPDSSYQFNLSYVVGADGQAIDWTWESPISAPMKQVFESILSDLPLFEPANLADKKICVKDQLRFLFSFEEDKIVTAPKEVFQVVENMPCFPGCEDNSMPKQHIRTCANKKMLEFIYSNLVYPPEAKAKGVEGKGVVRFIVNKNGAIINAQVVRPLGSGCDEAMLDVVEKMPRWIPGTQRGRPVPVYFNLPIKFSLD